MFTQERRQSDVGQIMCGCGVFRVRRICGFGFRTLLEEGLRCKEKKIDLLGENRRKKETIFLENCE